MQAQTLSVDRFDNLTIEVKVSKQFKARIRLAYIFFAIGGLILGKNNKIEVKTND